MYVYVCFKKMRPLIKSLQFFFCSDNSENNSTTSDEHTGRKPAIRAPAPFKNKLLLLVFVLFGLRYRLMVDNAKRIVPLLTKVDVL